MVPSCWPARARWAEDPQAPGDSAAGERRGGRQDVPTGLGAAPARGSLPALRGARPLKGTEARAPRRSSVRAAPRRRRSRRGLLGISPTGADGEKRAPTGRAPYSRAFPRTRGAGICGGGGRIKIVCTV